MKKHDRIILLDTDVVSHFISGGEVFMLPAIFPGYPLYILDKVYNELIRFPKKKIVVENLLLQKTLKEMPFPEENDDIKKEYAHIKKWMFKGDGEAACLAVVRYSKDILASSNLKDVKHYCSMHNIDLLTTMDFLCEALRSGLFDVSRCNLFIQNVLKAGSKLPVSKIEDYNCMPLSI